MYLPYPSYPSTQSLIFTLLGFLKSFLLFFKFVYMVWCEVPYKITNTKGRTLLVPTLSLISQQIVLGTWCTFNKYFVPYL